MAKKIKISQLPDATDLKNLWIFGKGPGTQNVKAPISLLRGNTAFVEWQERNPGKTYSDWIKLLQEPAQFAADGLEEIKTDITEFGVKAKADEAIRVENETIRKTNESGRILGENQRIGAEIIREGNEEERLMAEEERKDSETERKTSETERKEAEAGRKNSEAIRMGNERLRIEIEAKRVEAETARVVTETLRVESETERKTAEELRDHAETIRTASELDRIAAETDRIEAEDERISAETERKEAETHRESAETIRVETEDTRIVEEQLRKAAERSRVEAEESREMAEELREVNTTEAIVNAEGATQRANTASGIAEELNAHPMKVQGGLWFQWSLENKQYENTGIQAQGPVGTSFKILARYNTLEELTAAIPDGSGIDGVFAVGAVEPFSYYAWLYIDGEWRWDNQGQLRGAEGKSSYEVWLEIPENAGKPLKDYFKSLSPYVGPNLNWWVGSEDTGHKAPGTDAYSPRMNTETKNWEVFNDEEQKYVDTGILAEGVSVVVTEAVKSPNEYRLHFKHATGEFTTPNLQGQSALRVLDIDHEPTEADTHYEYEGVTYSYSIGDERRYYDPDAEEYIFFKLYDLNANGAVWDELGGGGGRLPTDVIMCSPTGFTEMEDKIYLPNGILE